MNELDNHLKTILKFNKEAQNHLLNSALKQFITDGNKEPFLIALRRIIEARGSISDVARRANISRQHMYKMLSGKGNPSFINISLLLGAVGLKLKVVEIDPPKRSFYHDAPL